MMRIVTGVLVMDSMMVIMDSKYSGYGWESDGEKEREYSEEARGWWLQ
jgi:hypothetical protein